MQDLYLSEDVDFLDRRLPDSELKSWLKEWTTGSTYGGPDKQVRRGQTRRSANPKPHFIQATYSYPGC